MSCNRNRSQRWLALGALSLVLAACAKEPPPPPPPPPAPAALPQPAPSAGAAPSEEWLVRSGSPGVLEKYPRGMPVRVGSEICLRDGEQVTLITRSGKSVTYAGPGCARRTERATPQNEGGFIFGWNGRGGPTEIEVAP